MVMMGRRDGFRRCPVAPRRGAPQQGFTVIELLVVIAIIGVMVGMLMPILTRVRHTAKIRETETLMARIANAITTMRENYDYDDLLILDRAALDPDIGPIDIGANKVAETVAIDITPSWLLKPDDPYFNVCKELDPNNPRWKTDYGDIASPERLKINERRYREPDKDGIFVKSKVFIHYHESSIRQIKGKWEVVDAWDMPIRYAARREVKDMDGVSPDDFVFHEFLISGGSRDGPDGLSKAFRKVESKETGDKPAFWDVVMPLKEFTYYQKP